MTTLPNNFKSSANAEAIPGMEESKGLIKMSNKIGPKAETLHHPRCYWPRM